MSTLQEVLKKSQPVIDSLENAVVRLGAQKLVELSYAAGVEIRLTYGLRTFAEQDALYAQGRTKPGNIVTKAKGGESMHNYSLAIDFVLSKSGYDMRADADKDGVADWIEVVAIAKQLGFEWGGDWVSFKDNPHFEMNFGLTKKKLLAGQRPTAAQISAAVEKINALEMRDEAMKEIESLQAKLGVQNQALASLEGRLAAVEKRLNMSGTEDYAKHYTAAVEAAKKHGFITTVADKSKLELNMIQMLYNKGVIPK